MSASLIAKSFIGQEVIVTTTTMVTYTEDDEVMSAPLTHEGVLIAADDTVLILGIQLESINMNEIVVRPIKAISMSILDNITIKLTEEEMALSSEANTSKLN